MTTGKLTALATWKAAAGRYEVPSVSEPGILRPVVKRRETPKKQKKTRAEKTKKTALV